MDKLVAVYGSLRKGFGNHRVLGDSEFVVQTTLEGDYRMISLGGFPGVMETKAKKSTSIVVEVYRVTDDYTAKSLDMLEGFRGKGCDNFYDREEVTLANGMVSEIYLLREEDYGNYDKVETGDWADAC